MLKGVNHKGIVKVIELKSKNASAMNTRIVSNYFFGIPIDGSHRYAFSKGDVGPEELEDRLFGAPDSGEFLGSLKLT